MLAFTEEIVQRLPEYSNPKCKIGRMVANGELFRLRRGLYETDGNVPGHVLADAIVSPSYLSFEYALWWYGMIPEAVYVYTSATLGKRKTKTFRNSFGRYSYRDVPEGVFHLGIRLLEDHGRYFWIASPEKAVCDQLNKLPPAKDADGLVRLMYGDQRFDDEDIGSLNRKDVAVLASRYRSANVRLLSEYLEDLRWSSRCGN